MKKLKLADKAADLVRAVSVALSRDHVKYVHNKEVAILVVPALQLRRAREVLQDLDLSLSIGVLTSSQRRYERAIRKMLED
jgi:hypothetical protein